MYITEQWKKFGGKSFQINQIIHQIFSQLIVCSKMFFFFEHSFLKPKVTFVQNSKVEFTITKWKEQLLILTIKKLEQENFSTFAWKITETITNSYGLFFDNRFTD